MGDRPEHCFPEWCSFENGEHDATCPLHPLVMTKQAFVDAMEGGAKAAIEDYLVLLNDLDHDEALELAVDLANEAAVCFVGIGSCERGWCKHS